MGDIWPMVHTERVALVADLANLGEGDWEVPSLCEGWSVHDVVAHLVDTALTTRLGFITAMVRSRFNFDRQNEAGIRRHRGATPDETLAALRAVAGRRSTPPAPLDSRVVEEVVHGEDIRRPLGIVRDHPTRTVTRALLHQTRTAASFGGAKEAVEHVRLVATDADASIGSGPEVSGPVLSLLLAVSRRTDALDQLTGPGLAALRQSL